MYSDFWASHRVGLQFDTDVSQKHWQQPVLQHYTETATIMHIYMQNCFHHLTCSRFKDWLNMVSTQANKTTAGMQEWQYFSPSLLSSIFPSYPFEMYLLSLFIFTFTPPSTYYITAMLSLKSMFSVST